MPDSESGFAEHSGFNRLPRRALELTDTTLCPACFAELRGAVCPACELDLRHPAATELAEVSARAARLLDRRRELIGRIRYDSPVALQRRERERLDGGLRGATAARPDPAQRIGAQGVGAQDVAMPVAQQPTVSVPVPIAAPWTRPATGQAYGPPPPPPPVQAPSPTAPRASRRSSVQVLLLVVGISLVSVAAVFFLLYAFTNYGIIGRSIVIGAVTVTAFAVASLLRRGRLTNTAEGIAVFAVVLVYLDAFAVRANNLFGSSSGDPLLYWGGALVLSSVGFLLWHRLSRLRVPSIVAFAALAPGVALVAGGLSAPVDGTTRVYLALLAAGLAGLVHPLADRVSADAAPRLPERTVAFSLACAGLALSFCTAFVVAPGIDAAVLPALAGVAVVSAAHAALLLRAPRQSPLLRGFAAGFSALAGLALSAGVATAAYRALPLEVALVVAAATTTAFLLVLLVALRRVGRATTSGRVLGAAAVAAAAVAAVAVVAPATQAFVLVVQAVLFSLGGAWQTAGVDDVAPASASALGSVLALAVVAVLGGVFAAATGTVRRFRGALVWGCCIVLVAAVPLLASAWAVTAGWLLLAALALALILARGAAARAAGLPLAVAGVVSGALGYAVSWASTGTWLAGSLVAIALLVGARWARVVVVPPAAAPVAHEPATVSPSAPFLWPAPAGAAVYRATLLGAAAVLAFIAVAAAAYQPAFESGSVATTAAAIDTVRFVSILGVVLVAVAALAAPFRLSTTDRHTLFALGALGAAPGATAAWVLLALEPAAQTLLPEPAASVLLSATALGALLAWLLPRAASGLPVERAVAAVAAAPVVFWVLDSVARLAQAGDGIRSLVAVVAALLVAAAALATTALRPAIPRIALDIGVAGVGVLGLFSAVGFGLEWLALLLAAVATLFCAVASDGLVTARGSRKHLGWVALVLATAALWWWLASDFPAPVEAWVLPVAGVLLFVALALWRGARSGASTDGDAASRASAHLVLGALLVALVPIGVAGAAGSTTRALTAVVVSAALLLAGSLLPGSGAARRYLDAVAIAGFTGMIVTGLCHTAFEVLGGRATVLSVDAWMVGLAAVLAIAAVAQTRLREAGSATRLWSARAMLLAAMTVLLAVETIGFGDPGFGALRAVAVVCAFSLLFLLASVVDHPLLSASIRWTALAFALVAAMGALSAGTVDPLELLTLPVAAALLVAGGFTLARVPASNSWSTLGVGIGVLLLPSLLLTDGDRPVWRLVAVGVVALLVFVTGVRLRLQAPVLIGAVVVLVHAATTFAPQIRSVYELTEWWVWAGVGGVPIIVYAALAERSVRTTRSVVMTIGSLR